MPRLKLLVALLIGWSSVLGMANGKIVRCNYNPLSIYRYGEYKFEPSDIDSSLCTHLIYPMEFSITPSEEFRVMNKTIDFDIGSVEGCLSRALKLKDSNPKLKIIAGVYFANYGYYIYRAMSFSARIRKNFIKTALNFVQTYHFDGLELNWDFLYQREGTDEEKRNFGKVLQELNTELKPFKLELSITVNGATKGNRTSCHLPAKYVDYINIMAYGYDRLEPTKFCHNAPIWSRDYRNVFSTFNHLFKIETPGEKLVLGIPFTGVYYKISDTSKFLADTTIDYKLTGMSYNRICNKYAQGWTNRSDPQQSAQILYSMNTYISYDNSLSIEEKVKYGVCIDVAGFMVSNIEDDDFRGKCGQKYPLLKTINDHFKNSDSTYSFHKFGVICYRPY